MSEIDKLTELWLDEGKPIATDFAQIAHDKLGISKTRAADFVNNQHNIAIKKSTLKPRKYSTIWTREIQDQVQMDLWDIGRGKSLQKVLKLDDETYENKYGNYKYGLFVMEVKSRKVWGKLLREKDAEDIQPALTEIFQDMYEHGRFGFPKSVLADGDFAHGVYQDFFANYGIEGNELQISHTEQRNKNVLIERFIRTFREKLKAYYSADATHFGEAFETTFQKIIRDYNNNLQQTINEKPQDVFVGDKDSLQGVPPLKSTPRTRQAEFGRFLRKGIRKSKGNVKQIINPLKNGVGKEGYQPGDYVRIWKAPPKHRYLMGKSDDPHYEDKIYRVNKRNKRFPGKFGLQPNYESRQTFNVQALNNDGTLDEVNTRPLRGWEMQKVSMDSIELRNWLQNHQMPRPQPEPRRERPRPAQPIQRIEREQRNRRPRQIYDPSEN